MSAFVSSHRHRAVPVILSALLLIASAVGTWMVIPAKAAPVVPTVATAPDSPAIVHPSSRKPAAMVIPKKKAKKKAVVVQRAVTTVQSAPAAQTAAVTPVVTRKTTTTKKSSGSSSAGTADAEFGPG